MRSNSKPVSQRQLRVGEQIRHLIADCFQRGNVPKELLDLPPVTVMEARVSPDFTYCKVFVSFLVIEAAASDDLTKQINLHRGFFRTVLAKNMRLRIAPEVRFYADSAQSEADHIEALLASDKVRQDLGPRDEDDVQDGADD